MIEKLRYSGYFKGIWDEGAGEWIVDEALTLEWSEGGKEKRLTVPKGSRTDLASIPRLLRGLIPQLGRHVRPAVVHDYCYRKARLERAYADRLFFQGMKVLGVPWAGCWVMYVAVRLFGWLSYRENGHCLR